MSSTAVPRSADMKQEKIINDFQQLRNEQRNLITNISKLEVDLKEHKTVIETLKAVDGGRRCYRLVGGVLCSRVVQDVLPELSASKDQLENMVSMGNDQLTKKGQEINKYIEVHNIKVKGQEPSASADEPAEPAESTERKVLVTA